MQRFEEVVVPALQKEYPEVMGVAKGKKGRKEIEVFKRKWICEWSSTIKIKFMSTLIIIRQTISEYLVIIAGTFLARVVVVVVPVDRAGASAIHFDIGF